MCENVIFSKKEKKKKNFILMNGLTDFSDSERKSFKTDKVGLYSITSSEIAKDITISLAKYFSKYSSIAITDATASVGGNSLSFLLHPLFNPVNLVELDPIRVNCLKHNISIIKDRIENKTFNIYSQSYLDIMMDLEEDVVFIDPPWGGPDYYKYDNIDLFLSNEVPLFNICNKLFTKPKLKIIVLKVPNNFGLTKFKNSLDKTIEISRFNNLEKLRKMDILFLKRK